MSITLRSALESQDAQAQAVANDQGQGQERTLVMKGPLAEVYTQALDIAYAKQDPVTDQPAVESQAIDAAIAQQIAQLITPGGEEASAAPSTIYGVSQAEVSETDVVEVTKELANKPEGTDFYLIIDGTQPGPNGEQSSAPQERMVELTAAMETLVKAHGGKVHYSFKDFASDVVGGAAHAAGGVAEVVGEVAGALA